MILINSKKCFYEPAIRTLVGDLNGSSIKRQRVDGKYMLWHTYTYFCAPVIFWFEIEAIGSMFREPDLGGYSLVGSVPSKNMGLAPVVSDLR